MKSEKKKKKQKLQTRASIEKWLARALLLTKAKSVVSYTIDVIRFNAKAKELISTDGRSMLVVKIKQSGTLLPFNLETGFYDVLGETLLKSDRDVNSRFPDYESVIPTGEKVCSGDILSGIVECMIKQQVSLDIWKYESVLKTLNKHFSDWVFTNVSNVLPVMMEADSDKYNVKYVVMPIKF